MMISIFDIVENIVGKGKNAGYHHFLLFPVFSIGFFPKSPDSVVRVNAQSPVLTTLRKKPFENMARKEEHDGYQQLLLFPLFSTLSEEKLFQFFHI